MEDDDAPSRWSVFHRPAPLLFCLAQVYDLEQPMQTGMEQCIREHNEQPNPRAFCTCWVNRWIALWDANDRAVWTQTGSATPHMQQMESVAAAQCGG
jgi:hypothetical protein